MTTGDLPPEPEAQLDASRARFIAELGERISTLRQSLARFAGGSEPAGELNALRRRVHALAAGAEVLRFTRAAEALSSAEAGLAGAGGWDPGAQVRERVLRILDLLPSLVLGAPVELAELDNPRLAPLREPLCVVVYGDATLEALLQPAVQRPGAGNHGIESHAARHHEQAIELAAQLSPDVLLIDGDDADVSEILPRLRQASGPRQAPVVAVASFDRPDALIRLMRRGVSRVLPKPADAAALQRTLRQVTLSESSALPPAPQYRKLTREELVEAIASEARRAFRDPAAPAGSGPSGAQLHLGSNAEVQAALWGSFARLRGLATRHGEGAVAFSREGPNGAIVLAPDAPRPSSPSSRPPSEPVPLHARKVVVADDDPAVRTLLANAFAELGATVLPARDGAEALDLAERHWPDALVSDTLMPQLDGFELCRRLRQDIAVSDLPVLLVAWREYLLERTRSPVTGRALDALDGPSLTLALRECLAPRVALEQRLAQHDAVHGRLNGLTPRLLLQMVCNRAPNALLSLRSGRLTFEFSIADGRPVHARWYDGDRVRGEGKPVLAPFLGIRAGRFSVESLFSPPNPHFEGDAMAVLNPAAVRARRAAELVSPSQLAQVEQVLLDPLAAAHYAEQFPTRDALLSQLGQPDALRRLRAEDHAGSEPGRLNALLADLARRGAIGALLDRDGQDLLPGGIAYRPSNSAPASVRSSSRAPARPSAVPATTSPATTSSARPAPAQEAAAAAPDTPDTAQPATPATADSPPAVALGSAVLQPAALQAEPEPEIPRAPAVPSFAPGRRRSGAPLDAAGLDAEALEAATREPGTADEPFFARDGSAGATDPSPPPGAALEPELREPSAAAFDARADLDERTSTEEELRPASSFDPESGDEPDSAWPPSPGARLRGALGRALLSLGAALIAYLAIRALAFRSWDSHSLRRAPLVMDSSPPPAVSPTATPSASPPARPAPPPDAGPASAKPGANTPVSSGPAASSSSPAATGPAASSSAAAMPLKLDSEVLELAPGTKVPPGQGVLEVRSDQPQRIYIDGVLMGNHAERLIPLGPGTYQLRLSNGTHFLERAVEVKAGRRTRVTARPSSAP
jgi:CheY-like chemotaxis protein